MAIYGQPSYKAVTRDQGSNRETVFYNNSASFKLRFQTTMTRQVFFFKQNLTQRYVILNRTWRKDMLMHSASKS